MVWKHQRANTKKKLDITVSKLMLLWAVLVLALICTVEVWTICSRHIKAVVRYLWACPTISPNSNWRINTAMSSAWLALLVQLSLLTFGKPWAIFVNLESPYWENLEFGIWNLDPLVQSTCPVEYFLLHLWQSLLISIKGLLVSGWRGG